MKAPGLSRWLFERLLHPDDRRFALADLEEELDRRTAAAGALRARLWYRAQLLRSVAPALRNRWERRPRNILSDLAQDLRFALRALAKAPLMTVVTVASLAIGIAVTTTVFNVANALLFRGPSSAISEPERLTAVFTSTSDGSRHGQNSYLDYLEIKRQVVAFEDTAAQRLGLVRIDGSDGGERRVIAEIVSGNYFNVLGIHMPVGRSFRPDETVVGAAFRVTVISRRLWEEEFDLRPDVVGQTLRVDGNPFTVIGVAPDDLISRVLALRTDVWVPIGIPGGVFRSTEQELAARGDRDYGIVGRLRPGADLGAAQAQVDLAAARLHAAFGKVWEDDLEQPRRLTVLAEREARVPPDFFPALAAVSSIVLLAAGLILVVACSNVAGVMLSRADQRRREMAVRLALGARRSRIIRMLLTESTLLAAIAGVTGVWLSALISARFNRVSLPVGGIVLEFDLRPDGTVLAFGLVVAALTTLVFGLTPALQATRRNFVPSLRGIAADTSGRIRRFQPRNLLVVAQVAVALVFVVGAGVALRSFGELIDMDWGVNPERIAIMSREVPEEVAPDSFVDYYRELQDRLAVDPAIEAVTVARTAEGSMLAIDSQAEVAIDGYERAADERLRFPVNAVAPGYLEIMGVRMVAGRTFAERDDAAAVPVAVVNEAFAQRFWPGESALGKRFRVLGRRDGDDQDVPEGRALEIVGVAADARYQGFEGTGQFYFWTPLYQSPSRLVTLLARGRTSVDDAVALLRGEIDPTEREFTLIDPQPYEELMNFQFVFVRILGQTLAWGAGFGLLLAMIGLYGIVSHAVTRRRKEMAIRQAVGARPAEATRVVMRDGLRLTVWGLFLGLAVVLPISALLRSDISGIRPIDPLSAVAGVTLLLAAAAMASFVPARRANRTDPVESLRQE